MAENSPSQLLRDTSEAIENTWAKGTGTWDAQRRSLVKGRLTALRQADGANTSKLTALCATIDELIEEFDKQKELFSKTCSELWITLSNASLEKALNNFIATKQDYMESINNPASEVCKL